MGNTYSNIIVKGPPRNQIVACLELQRQRAFVSPTISSLTFVYAPAEAWEALAEELSRTCRCLALFVSTYDSDVFQYALYDDGRRIDEYNSAPDYFDGEVWEGHDGESEVSGHEPGPAGGDARLLCMSFGAEHAIEQVEALLHPPVAEAIRRAGEDAYSQHWALAEAVGWPPVACISQYEDFERDDIDQDLVLAFNGDPVIKTPA